MCKITNKNLKHNYATKFPYKFSGRYQLRLELDQTCSKTNIAASSSFITLKLFIDKIISFIFKRERKWVLICLNNNSSNKQTKVLLNIRSICERTLLSRKEVLEKSTTELSQTFMNPDKILWNYKKLQDFFPNSYLINLDTRPDRITDLQEHLNIIGQSTFNYKKVSAVNGATIPENEYEKMSKSRSATMSGKDDRKGRYACFQSHLKVLKQAKQAEHPNVLILEDDVRFMPKHLAGNYLEKVFNKELPSDWGMLFLGHYDANPKKKEAYSEHLIRPGEPYDLHAYVVHESMYDTLIETLEKELRKTEKESMRAIDVVIAEDLAQSSKWRSKIFACKDNVAFQTAGLSSITQQVILGNYGKEVKELRAYYNQPSNPTKTADGMPIMPPLLKGTLYQMAFHLINLFDKHGIRYWADGGTLLGVARHQGLIPHDDDIDLCIFPEDTAKLKASEFVKELKELGLEINDHWLGAKVFCTKDHPLGCTHNKDNCYFKTPSIDLFFTEQHTSKDGEKLYQYREKRVLELWPNYTHLHDHLFDEHGQIKKKKFGPIQINVPSEEGTKRYCDLAYGSNWPFEIYVQYDHIHEKGKQRIPTSFTDARLGPVAFWDNLKPIK